MGSSAISPASRQRYMRGVPYVQVPTTLLAAGRLIGGWQDGDQPSSRQEHDRRVPSAARRVIADLETLDTLSQRELVAGLAEVIKYGPIADSDFFGWIETNIDDLLGRDKTALGHAVASHVA